MADIHFARHAKRKQYKHSAIGRFLEKILVNTDRVYECTPCWEWQAYINDRGYARFKAFGENYAHRVSYLYFTGDIPEGFDIDHKCRNPRCQSPFHLQAVTHAKNKDLARNTKTHCIRGHAFNEQNTHFTGKGDRVCKACRYEAIKRWRKNHPDEAREVYRRDKAQYRAKGGIW